MEKISVNPRQKMGKKVGFLYEICQISLTIKKFYLHKKYKETKKMKTINVSNLEVYSVQPLAKDTINMLKAFQDIPNCGIRYGCFQVAFTLMTNGIFRSQIQEDPLALITLVKDRLLEEECPDLSTKIIIKNIGCWWEEVSEEYCGEVYDIEALMEDPFMEEVWV
jgi:hypothetical protein